MGIPAFCSLKIILPAFYARKVMDKPLYCSLAAITVNIVLNIILMQPLKQGGIALATVISALVNNTLLLWLLRRGGVRIRVREVLPAGVRSLLLAAATGYGCFYLHRLWHGVGARGWFAELGMFVAAAALFALLYFTGALLCRAREPREFLGMLRRRKSGA